MAMMKMKKMPLVFFLLHLLHHLHRPQTWTWKTLHNFVNLYILKFPSAFSLQQTVRFKKLGQPSASFCENAFPPALKQPQPKGFNDCHALAAGFHFNGLHNFKHGVHLGVTAHNVPISAHNARVFVSARILREICKNAAVIKIRQIHLTCVMKIIGHR